MAVIPRQIQGPASLGTVYGIDGLTATPVQIPVFGDVYKVEIDLSNNAEDVTLRMYSAASAPTVGTTDANMWLRGKAGEVVSYVLPSPVNWATGMWVAAVQEKGGTAGATAPTGIVNVLVSMSL